MTGAGDTTPRAASPLENDDLLSEILLDLPPAPSSLPRASLVCKRWYRIVSDPGFICRFRARHHRNAPVLGFLKSCKGEISFTPMLDPPERIPSGRFSLPIDDRSRMKIVSCRHGLVLLHDLMRLQLLVWDPVTRDQHRIAYPQEFFDNDGISTQGTVLRAAGDVNGGGSSSYFQVVLIGNDKGVTQAIASVYSSETEEWGALISTACPSMYPSPRSCIQIGGSLYWLFTGLSSNGVLEFDLDRQSLALIEMPEETLHWLGHFKIMQAEGGGLGFLFVQAEETLELSSRLEFWKADVDAGWVLGRSVELGKQLLLSLSSEGRRELFLYGYVDENNVLLVRTRTTIFVIQLDSMQLKKSIETSCINFGHPFSCVYAAGI